MAKSTPSKARGGRRRSARPNLGADQSPKPVASRPEHPFLIVGIGASAGGLAAFRSFFASLSADPGMAFVLVQHLAPSHKSMLVELLEPHVPLPITLAQDGTEVVKNHIYVIPQDATLTMTGNILRVDSPAPARAHRRPIDSFFSSLAENHNDCAVGIILSGVGSDGSLGVQAIKEHGGLTLAQAEFDATAMSGMPQSATSTGSVDYVLAVDAMAAKLAEYKSHLGKVEALKGLDGIRDDALEHLAVITTLVRNRLKHDFSGYKPNTLVRRIQRRMQVLQIETVSGYVEHLRKEKEEAHALFRELLISVTRFFRDEEAFEALKRSALPSLLANRSSQDPIRVWVVGCATGEEVYSLAVLLQEAMEANSSTHPVSIFGTDIDADAIAFARTARYRKVDGLSPERLARWFVKDKDDYCPLRIIRDMCVFSEHSVVKDPPFSKLDLLSCRNVLIYLDHDRQQRVMQTFHYALRSGGYLFLGPSESVPGEPRLFAMIDKKHRILERQDDVRAVLPEFQRNALPHTVEVTPLVARHEDRLDQNARRIMERHSPAYFVIDRNYDILRFSGGEAAPYLEPSAGAASLHLFNILRKSLRAQVRTAIQKAFDKNQSVFDDNLAIRIDGKPCAITLIVEPIADGTLPGKLLVVGFRERGALTETSDKLKGGRLEPNADEEALQQELRAAKAQAQASSNELENHIEEMKSMTEEYQSVVEELQSSNEELENLQGGDAVDQRGASDDQQRNAG